MYFNFIKSSIQSVTWHMWSLIFLKFYVVDSETLAALIKYRQMRNKLWKPASNMTVIGVLRMALSWHYPVLEPMFDQYALLLAVGYLISKTWYSWITYWAFYWIHSRYGAERLTNVMTLQFKKFKYPLLLLQLSWGEFKILCMISLVSE